MDHQELKPERPRWLLKLTLPVFLLIGFTTGFIFGPLFWPYAMATSYGKFEDLKYSYMGAAICVGAAFIVWLIFWKNVLDTSIPEDGPGGTLAPLSNEQHQPEAEGH